VDFLFVFIFFVFVYFPGTRVFYLHGN
jgi:hypothetical protein